MLFKIKITFVLLLFLSHNLVNNFIFCKKTVDDFSELNKTVVSNIYYPSSIKEVQQIINTSKKIGKKISIAGKKHSQGGHAFYNDAIVIDIKKFNKIIKLDTNKKIVTVQPGVTWEQLQEFINPYNLAIKVMQTVQIFTIGGSLSVNAHGRDPKYGPLIETVKKIKILLASGKIVEASHTKNYELFKLAIGGYGLFGVILEADIELTDNLVYKKTANVIKISDYTDFVRNKVIQNPNLGLHYGIICLAPYDFFKKILVVNYTNINTHITKIPANAYKLEQENFVFVNRIGLYLKKHFNVLNSISTVTEWPAIIIREKLPHTTCRNNAMRHPVKCLENLTSNKTKSPDILQSYFIPINAFTDFMNYLRSCASEKSLKVLYVFTRYIPKNMESFLSYTINDYFEIVIFISHNTDAKSIKRVKLWTQNVISKVLSYGGKYYLPVRLYPSKKQLEIAYPQIHDFFTKKLYYDPNKLFVNHFYKKYA